MGVDLPAFPGLVRAGQRAGLALETVADRMHLRPDDLAVVVQIESAWEPTAVNPTSRAAGLIQWLPATAVALGWATDAASAADTITSWDAEQQLLRIPEYIAAAAAGRELARFPSAELTGQIDVADLYLLVFAPAFAGMPDAAVIFAPGTAGALQNPALTDDSGAITVASVRERLEAASAAADQLPRIATDTWQAPPPYRPQPGSPRPTPQTPRPSSPSSTDGPGLGWLLLGFAALGTVIALRRERVRS